MPNLANNKFTITILTALISIASANAANNPKMFTGKYEVLKCPLYSSQSDQDFSKAYVNIEFERDGSPTIAMNFYGYAGSMYEEFTLLKNPRQAPGTDVETHGPVIETAKVAWPSATELILTIRTQRPSWNYDNTIINTLTLKNNKFQIKKRNSSGETRTCLLQRIK